jgi:hypothetical protein
MGPRHWPTRSPSARQAALAGRGFGNCSVDSNVRLEEVGVHVPGSFMVTFFECGHHLAELAPDPVRGHADHAERADRKEGQGHGVVAAVDLEARGCCGDDPGGVGHVTGCVLKGHDVGDVARQAQQRRRGDAPAGAHRDVVEDDRQVGRRRHRREVPVEGVLGGAVVVRGDAQDAVDAGVAGRLGQLDRVAGVVRARPRQHRDGHRLGDGPPQGEALVVGEHRALTGRPGKHQAVGAVLAEPPGEGDCRVEVELAVLVEGGHHGGQHRAEPGCGRVRGHRGHATRGLCTHRAAGPDALRPRRARPASRRRRRPPPRWRRPSPRTR